MFYYCISPPHPKNVCGYTHVLDIILTEPGPRRSGWSPFSGAESVINMADHSSPPKSLPFFDLLFTPLPWVRKPEAGENDYLISFSHSNQINDCWSLTKLKLARGTPSCRSFAAAAFKTFRIPSKRLTALPRDAGRNKHLPASQPRLSLASRLQREWQVGLCCENIWISQCLGFPGCYEALYFGHFRSQLLPQKLLHD